MMTRPETHRYRLHGLPIIVDASDSSLAERVAFLLHLLRAEPAPADPLPPALSFRVRREPEVIPDEAEPIDTHERGATLLQAGGRLYLRHGMEGAQIDPAGGQAMLWCTDDNPGLLFDLLSLSLVALLSPRGHFLLHAACLAHETGGIVISARSHSGKSSLALGLVQAGWGYLSDDMVLLSLSGEDIEARGLSRDFRLDDDAVPHFPALFSELPAPVLDKHHLDMGTLFPGQYTPVCRPRVFIVPEIADVAVSTITPISPGKVLLHLLSQTSFITRDKAVASRQMDVLRMLAISVTAYRLRAGRDLYHNPELAGAFLAPLMAT